jgi:hypothetical protein
MAKANSRPFSSRAWVSLFGKTEDIAAAAEAPQIATAAAVRCPPAFGRLIQQQKAR